MDTGLEEQIRGAEKAPEPGTMKPRQVIHSASGELPANVVQSALDSAGYSYVYNVETRERSVVNNNMLRSVLRRKDLSGNFVFTTHKPIEPPKRGAVPCMLHQDNPARKTFDAMGLPVCRKSNMPSEPEMHRHMKAKHRKEWETIKEVEERKRQTEMFDLQKATLLALEKNLAK